MDTVIIAHDTVAIPAGFDAFARRIELGTPGGSGTGLGILSNASLAINDIFSVDSNQNAGILIRSADLFNNGDLIISDTETGIHLEDGEIQNLFSMDISNCRYGISNEGLIKNESGSILNLKSIEKISIVSKGGVLNDGLMNLNQQKDVFFKSTTSGSIKDSLVNNGIVKVANANRVFVDMAIIKNFGKIELDNIETGIVQYVTDGFFYNLDTIVMDTVKRVGIDIDGSIEIVNDGTMIFDQLEGSAIDINSITGQLTQNGVLEIRKSVGTIPVIFNDGEIHNYGALYIDSTETVLRSIHNEKVFNNYGTIGLSNFQIGLRNSGEFNNPGGSIILSLGSQEGILSSGEFSNSSNGMIDIQNCYNGILITDGIFANELNSTIHSSSIINIPFEVEELGQMDIQGILEIEN